MSAAGASLSAGCSRPVCLRVMFRLVIKGTNSGSRLWLARRMTGALAGALPGRAICVAAGTAYAGKARGRKDEPFEAGRGPPATAALTPGEWPGGIAPPALAEPGVRVSPHRAPTGRPWVRATRCQWTKSLGWRCRTAVSQSHARSGLPRRRLNFCIAHRTRYWSMRNAMGYSLER